jgi:hypothetical protein
MSESAGRHRLGLAQELGLSRSLIDRWCSAWSDEHDSGARNPLDRLVIWINFLRTRAVDEHRAVLPMAWLADRLGYTLHARDGSIVVTDSVLATVGRLVSESSDAVTTALAAIDDGEVEPLERQQIGKELRELEAAIADLKVKLRLRVEVAS